MKVHRARQRSSLGNDELLSAVLTPRATALAMAAAMGAFVLMIAERRLVGAAATPLHPLLLFTVLVTTIATAAGLRLLIRLDAASTIGQQRLVVWAPRISLIVLAVALWTPGTPPWVGALVVTLAVAGEVLTTGRLTRIDSIARRGAWRRNAPSSRPVRATDAAKIADERLRGTAADEGSIEQTTERCQLHDGGSLLRGRIRTSFKPGQRTAWSHVAFCPPFDHIPRLEFEQIHGPNARIKVGSLLPYGVRFELKLMRASDREESVTLTFVVSQRQAASSVDAEMG